MIILSECGHHSPDNVRTPKILGGNGATEAQWPSVGLLFNKRHNTKCTASLITTKWAVVSYSCLTDNGLHKIESNMNRDWSLYAGGSHLLNNTGNATIQMRIVKNIVPHPQVRRLVKSLRYLIN